MWAYLVRRLLLALVAISGVLVIVFFLSHIIPGRFQNSSFVSWGG